MKKVVILFIMFISLLCIDINIVSAANNSIVINHSPVDEEIKDDDRKNINALGLIISITDSNGNQIISNSMMEIKYGEPLDLCSVNGFCNKGNNILIGVRQYKSMLNNAKMTLNNENIDFNYNPTTNILYYAFTIKNDTDEKGEINLYSIPSADSSIIKLSALNLDTDDSDYRILFDIYVENNGEKEKISTNNYISKTYPEIYLNYSIQQVKEGMKFYIVPKEVEETKLIGYEIEHKYYDDDSNLQTDVKTVDEEPVLNDLDSAIVLTAADKGTQNLKLKIKAPAKSSIKINHLQDGNDTLNDISNNLNIIYSQITIEKTDGRKINLSKTIKYNTPIEVCSKLEYCQKGNKINITLKDGKSDFVSSKMSFDNENIAYKELEDGSIEYSITITDDLLHSGVINYTTKPTIDDSYIYLSVNPGYGVYSFMIYADTGVGPLPVGVMKIGSGAYLNSYLKKVDENTTYYIVPTYTSGRQFTDYVINHLDQNSQIIDTEKFDKAPKFDDIDGSIKVETKKGSITNVIINSKNPESKLTVNVKDINNFDLPIGYFENKNLDYGQSIRHYIYAVDETDDSYSLVWTLEHKFNENPTLENKLVPGQKYLITTKGHDYFKLDRYETTIEGKKVTKELENYDLPIYGSYSPITDAQKANGLIFKIDEDGVSDIDLYGSSYASVTYVMKYASHDEDRADNAKKTHYFEFGRGKFYKLLSEKDGKRVYVINLSCTEESDECISRDKLKVDTNGYTTVYYPLGESQYIEYNGYEGNFRTGIISTSEIKDTSYYGSVKNTRVYYANYQDPYAIKTVKKVDQDGNPLDSSFNITTKILNQDMKFVYNYYEEREINGKKYKNVYEVKDVIPVNDNNEDSIINTKDGKFVLYYPVMFNYHNNVWLEKPSSGVELNLMQINELDKDGNVTKASVVTAQAKAGNYKLSLTPNDNNKDNVLRINNSIKNIDKYVKENWDSDEYLTNYLNTFAHDEILLNASGITNSTPMYKQYSQNYVISDKKGPTVKHTIIGNSNEDTVYTYLVYEKESNTLLEEINIRANEEGYLNITLLEDNKTYIIREKINNKDYSNTKVEVKNGQAKEDENGKYYEFTYDSDLTKVYEVNFYNKYNDVKVPNTGDNILLYVLISFVSLVALILITLKLKKVNS